MSREKRRPRHRLHVDKITSIGVITGEVGGDNPQSRVEFWKAADQPSAPESPRPLSKTEWREELRKAREDHKENQELLARLARKDLETEREMEKQEMKKAREASDQIQARAVALQKADRDTYGYDDVGLAKARVEIREQHPELADAEPLIVYDAGNPVPVGLRKASEVSVPEKSVAEAAADVIRKQAELTLLRHVADTGGTGSKAGSLEQIRARLWATPQGKRLDALARHPTFGNMPVSQVGQPGSDSLGKHSEAWEMIQKGRMD